VPPHNFRVKLPRPAFVPALKRLGRTLPARRHAGCSSVVREPRQPACRYSRNHSGPAAQLTAGVSRTNQHLRGGTLSMKVRDPHALRERFASDPGSEAGRIAATLARPLALAVSPRRGLTEMNSSAKRQVTWSWWR